MMKIAALFFVGLYLGACGQSSVSHSNLTGVGAAYPKAPDTELTPGTLCANPDYMRYDEQIPYCKRDVHSSTKREIIKEYDREFGYNVEHMPRSQFKIDHYIPLCAGGSNKKTNLWPQHNSVYRHTDPIEQKVCLLMSAGSMLQKEAVSIIRHVKFNLGDARRIIRELDDRLY